MDCLDAICSLRLPSRLPSLHQGCGYDEGDCCECTCVGENCGTAIYFCVDPTSGCVDPRIDEFPDCTDGWIVGIGDGHCDSRYTLDNNNEVPCVKANRANRARGKRKK